MISALILLYSIGAGFTTRYLWTLVRDIPREELPMGHVALAAVMVLGMAIVWPVFWVWLLIDMWRE